MGAPWPPAHDLRLMGLIWLGHSLGEIAQLSIQWFGIQYSRSAIGGRLNRLRLLHEDCTLRAGLAVGRGANGKMPTSLHKPRANRHGGSWYEKKKNIEIGRSVAIKIACCGSPVDFIGLSEKHGVCHWPLWDDTHEDRKYCGNKVMDGHRPDRSAHVYCQAHYEIGHQTPHRRGSKPSAEILTLAARRQNRFTMKRRAA